MQSIRTQGMALRILIAEQVADDPPRYLETLRRSGIEPSADIVKTNQQFRKKIASSQYDLFISDLEFPGWSYREALSDLQRLQIEAPLIIITEHLTDSKAMDCVEAGAFDCILKDRLYRLTLATRRYLIERSLHQDRIKAESSLLDTIQSRQAIIEASPLAIIALDNEGRVQIWNRGAERMFGWTEPEVLGRVLPTVPETRKAEFRAILEAQLHGQSHSDLETVRTRKDGSEVNVSLWTAPLRGADGAISGKLTVIADTSEKKRAEEERSRLQTQEEQARAEASIAKRFRKLLESAPDAFLEVDASGTIVTANVEAERLFRCSREELVGQKIESLIPNRYRGKHVNHRDVYSDRPVTRPMGSGLNLFALRKDGTEFAVDINLSPVEEEGGSHVICIVRDVSERRRAEEQIRFLNQNLERRTEDLAIANRELELRNREVERATV